MNKIVKALIIIFLEVLFDIEFIKFFSTYLNVPIIYIKTIVILVHQTTSTLVWLIVIFKHAKLSISYSSNGFFHWTDIHCTKPLLVSCSTLDLGRNLILNICCICLYFCLETMVQLHIVTCITQHINTTNMFLTSVWFFLLFSFCFGVYEMIICFMMSLSL